MDCEGTSKSYVNLFNIVGEAVVDSIGARYLSDGLEAIPRAFLGMGPVPSEDCCPDLVVWISNVRVFDATPPDGLREGELGAHWGLAFDVNVRVGQCYLEVDEKGHPFPPEDITDMTEILNRYGHSTYIGALLVKGQAGMGDCAISLTPQPMFPFQSGGCAGWQFAITVGTL